MSGPCPFLPLIEEFGDPRSNEVFSRSRYVAAMVDAEVALARAQAHARVIPEVAAQAIAEAGVRFAADAAFWDEARLVGYPVVPLVHRLAALAGEWGGYVHWGATTQDIMDTGLVLQLREARVRLEELLLATGDALAALCTEHAATPIAGRTHGQVAVPTTFGAKAAVWLDEVMRHLERLREGDPRVLVAELAGAGGTLASLGDDGAAVRRRFAEILGLEAPLTPWHVARDGLGEHVALCALAAASAAKIGRELATLARTELAEVRERFVAGRGSSSTMPQKRNPISCEAAVGLGNLAAGMSGAFVRALQPENERAAGDWQIEWDAIPLVTTAAAGALAAILDVLQGLEVDADAMRRNLVARPEVLSESVMMRLSPHVGRQRAHEIVYAAVQDAVATGETIPAALAASADISAVLSPAELADALRPESYLGEAPAIARGAAAAWAGRSTPAPE